MLCQTPVDPCAAAGKCVGRADTFIITALYYIAQKYAADAFITHGNVTFAQRLSASDCDITIVIDIAVTHGSLLQQLRRLLFLLILDVIWKQASSMLVYGGICCTRYVCCIQL
jgi:hypothetical protein